MIVQSAIFYIVLREGLKMIFDKRLEWKEVKLGLKCSLDTHTEIQ